MYECMEPSTPKKIHARNSVCRCCGGLYESRHMLRIFRKSGIDKNLPSRIFHACGIAISETDCLPKVICRKCEGFIFKVNDFKQKCQNIQMGLEHEQKCSVKRCTELSPSCKQPSKRVATDEIRGQTSAKQLTFGKKPALSFEEERSESVEEACPSMLELENSEEESTSLPEVRDQADPDRQICEDQIIAALNSKEAHDSAEIIAKHCPSVLSALKLIITEEISSACQKQCRRSDGSVLYGNTYESLKNFSFDGVWKEMERNIPFLIDIMNAVSGKNGATDCITENTDLQVKYSFVNSILMNERWHELSVLKRVNTLLVIEGGCTKQVRIIYYVCLSLTCRNQFHAGTVIAKINL